MVLGGLNEGTWPAEQSADPWMSRPMRSDLGLNPAEQRIGAAAHDFAQALAAPVVYLTRAGRVEGAETVPSRWLLRLDTVLLAAGLSLDDAAAILDWQALLDRPAGAAAAGRGAAAPALGDAHREMAARPLCDLCRAHPPPEEARRSGGGSGRR
jgi:ATP-dependent helicase/nuclease subunit B